MGLVPFVRAIPSEGKIGNTIKIIGTGLAGATGVSFNGVSSTFTFVSDTEITAKVPKGAATGPIEVFVPSGKLLSNVAFQVIK
jgi:hypothetical protein